MATASAKKVYEENMKQKAHKEAKLREDAEVVAEKMNGLSLRIGTKTSSTGKIFGSINTVMIAEALEKEGFNIERKNITLKGEAIKEVGNYEANVKIYKNIKVVVPFEVYSEE